MVGRLILASVVAAFLLAASSSLAEINRPALCKERKTKAAGKKAIEIMRALGKTAKRPNATRLALDLSKAESKFTKAIAGAEAGGPCATYGDAAELEAIITSSVIDIIGKDAGDIIVWTSQSTEHPILGGPEDLTPAVACTHPWILIDVSWTSQQLGSDCRYTYEATWVCLDASTVETEEKTGDRVGLCLTFG